MTADEHDGERPPVADELRSHGVSVESVDSRDPLTVTYLTAFPANEVHRREVGRACNALLDLAAGGAWAPTRVEATVVRSPGDVLGTWHAEPEWFRALLADEITETEFSVRVVETISNADDPDANGPDANGPDADGPDANGPDADGPDAEGGA
ncbi:hypothetical protein [Haloparvum sedimenti]|uniref:hypothetical protein n=1 Tax=Haloparvum sedimenti TaxID=1678448 RepID=UPI00071E879E|nr:hypothetical protein [Haloparvum sedimenti]